MNVLIFTFWTWTIAAEGVHSSSYKEYGNLLSLASGVKTYSQIRKEEAAERRKISSTHKGSEQ